jgi:chemotaxis protein MotB
VRRSLVGTATSAEERRRKLNEARAMLKRMTDDRRSAGERAQAFEARAKKEARRAKELENRLVRLQSRLESQEVTVRKTREQLQINIIERLLFDSGNIRIKESGRKTLDRIGEILKDLSSRMIWIEGHTDNVPISGALSNRYPTNWELSTARATAVVRHLQGLGIPPEQLSAAGYASYQPVGDNDTPEGRSRNRRIVILLSRRRPTN